MASPTISRRGVLAVAAAAPALAAKGSAQASVAAFAPRPLGFDPKSVAGLSERLLTSHYENNYIGAVKRLGQITADLALVDPAAAPGYRLNGLKREELIAWNSMILHELYFASFGGREPLGPGLGSQIEKDFGSAERWRSEFASMGKALGGGSGWVLLSWSRRDGRLVNQWAADHTMTLADGAPILALDMYEHAYAIDYGAKAAGYIDAFLGALSWSHANQRFAQASSERI